MRKYFSPASTTAISGVKILINRRGAHSAIAVKTIDKATHTLYIIASTL